MIPEEHRVHLIQSGISFMRAITEAYGTDEGMQLWDTIANTIDPEVKGQIFFAMLTGEYNDTIDIIGCHHTADKISMIKALRLVSGMGLKEAKDSTEEVMIGKKLRITVKPDKRSAFITDLRGAGFTV